MKIFLIFCCISAVCITAGAQNRTLEELHQLNSQFMQNVMRNDTVAHYGDIIHPYDFLFIDANGVVVDREGYMRKRALRGGDTAAMRDYRYADENIRLFGNTAIVVAKAVYMACKGSYWLEEQARCTDTFIKERGRWWCIHAQLTKINL